MATPKDRFEIYYAEKLWELIPSYHRHEDGIAVRPGVLRAIVELWAEQLAQVRRSQDRLWEDTFVDLADDWAIAYLGDLVGTRLVSALNPRGRRIDVAKTIYYRRRKGTPRVLEELVADITGWEGKVVESFRGLARMRHGLDPARPARTGWADLRSVRIAALAGSPWDEHPHTPDVRRGGRWNIPTLTIFLWRLAERRLEGVMPFALADGISFTFDPSGRDVPLFAPRARPEQFDWDQWRSARPWDVPAPIRCRLLGHAEYEIEEATLAALIAAGLISDPQADELRPLVNVRFADEPHLHDQLALAPSAGTFLSPPVYDAILAGSIVEECGKRALLPAAMRIDLAPAVAIPREHVAAANLSNFSTAATGKDVAIDPDRGRFQFLAGPPAQPAQLRVMYHDGLAGRIGAGAYDRHDAIVSTPAITYAGGGAAIGPGTLPTAGAAEVADSATYSPIPDAGGITELVVQARDRQRPYLRLDADWTLTAAGGIEATLVLDGLWIGADAPRAVVVDGAWTRVLVRHCTLDPGGTDVENHPIHPVTLEIAGDVDEVVIDRTILPAIVVRPGAVVDRIVCRDAILHPAPNGVAIAMSPGTLHLHRVTVLGGLDVERLSASEALITGHVDVTDTQAGCFRFSAAPANSRLPHRFESYALIDAPTLFTSRRFGHPGYVQLGEAAPIEIVRGAENGSEMGAWSDLANPIKQDSLDRKVAEYLPFGLVPSFVRVT